MLPAVPDDLAPFLAQVAAAADLCLKPCRHGVRFRDPEPAAAAPTDCCLRIEARDPAGGRCEDADVELEIYRSGSELNLMLSRCADPEAPLLWHGSHAVWMDGASGERCSRPADGAALEALARRIRALVSGD
jgi:hypothetical protein